MFFLAFVPKIPGFWVVFETNGNSSVFPLFYIDNNIFFAKKVENMPKPGRRKRTVVLLCMLYNAEDYL